MSTSLSRRSAHLALTLVFGLWFSGCDTPDAEVNSPSEPITDLAPSERTADVVLVGTTLGSPIEGLTPDEEARFEAGLEEFAGGEGVEDGLGPVFNASACVTCHDNPVGGTTGLVETRFGRIDRSFRDRVRAIFNPLANLGGSLIQTDGIGLVNTPNGSFTFVGEVVPRAANVSAGRVTTQLFGLGLVDAVPDETFFRLARRQAEVSPDTRGEVSIVTEIVSGRPRVGKFGWKAQVPTLFQFSADAYNNEMGITSPQQPDELCPQGNCDLLKYNPVPELNDDGEDVVLFADFMMMLGPPPRGRSTRQTEQGERVFDAIGCDNCHTPTFTTGRSPIAALSRKTFQPFSDFLLHDMGSLGDGIEQNRANGREMRTAPLWGANSRTSFLHDGRSTTLEAAILAHDGQGRRARNRFAELNGDSRRALLAFLNSI